jgi:hypothetical protein
MTAEFTAPYRHAAAELALEPLPLDPDQIVEGEPATFGVTLFERNGVECGVWEITPGVATDVEEQEVFLVISGSATIEIEGGPTLEVGPGDVGALRRGDRTTWRVHETLRKLYVIDSRADAAA